MARIWPRQGFHGKSLAKARSGQGKVRPRQGLHGFQVRSKEGFPGKIRHPPRFGQAKPRLTKVRDQVARPKMKVRLGARFNS
ncbi:hypothetical protein E3N88_29284 [Mikania micrantha]|uniref:Uncharacterized protein n=1 Tax=Mikania micrantha TaxID=192012 RepID=A0A5N6MIC9_9ASTR|nr:hypothetical protein E3N88_29284 [Mikania micrantha]